MRIVSIIIIWNMVLMTFSIAQPLNPVKIYNADELIAIAKNKGLSELRKMIYPIDLVHLDPKYQSIIIDLEYKEGFLRKHHDVDTIYQYFLPELTMELYDFYDTLKVWNKLFEYYCNVPKVIKSDTIYSLHIRIGSFLKLLVRNNSPELIKRLEKDYYEWELLAKKAPPKYYPTIEEMRNIPLAELLKFKESDLYVDWAYNMLELAGALNYLKVEGFDNSLLEELKKKQSSPFDSSYSFSKPFFPDSSIYHS